jgi:Protein of unknown function (DUF2635)
MTDRRIVKPTKGYTIPDPYGRIVPPEGAIVIWSGYWERRLQEGGIEFFEIEPEPPPKAPSKSRNKKATEES